MVRISNKKNIDYGNKDDGNKGDVVLVDEKKNHKHKHKKLPKLPLCLRILIYSFISITTLFFVLSFGCIISLLIVCSSRDLEIEKAGVIKFSSGVGVRLEKIKFRKNDIKNVELKLEVGQVVVNDKKGREISTLKNLQFSISPLNVFNGRIITSIGELSNFNVNVDAVDLLDSVKQNSKEFSLEDNIKFISSFSSYFATNLSREANRLTTLFSNGVVVKDVSFVYLDRNNEMRTIFRVEKSSTKLLNEKKLDKQSVALLKSLRSFDEKAKEKNSAIVKAVSSILSAQNDGNRDVLVGKTTVFFENKKISIEFICDLFQNEIKSCAIRTNDIHLHLLENVIGKGDYFDGDDKGTLKVFLGFSKNNIEYSAMEANFDFGAEVPFKGIKMSIQKANLSIMFAKNFNEILSTKFDLIAGGRKISSVNISNLSFKDKKPSFSADISFNEVDIANIISFANKDWSNKEKNGGNVNNDKKSPFRGFVDGNMSLVVKNGVVVKDSKKISNLILKKVFLNFEGFDLDLSMFTLKVLSVGERILMRANDGEEDKYIGLVYDVNNKNVELEFKNYIVDRERFKKLKEIVLTKTSQFFFKDINYETLINGKIVVPFDGNVLQMHKSFIDFRADITDESFSKKTERITTFKVSKSSNSNKGVAVFDFNDIDEKSLLYNVRKRKNDKSIISAEFELDNKNNLKLNGKWDFNDKQLCKFSSSKTNQVDVLVEADKFNVDIKLKTQKQDYVKVKTKDIKIDLTTAKSLIVLIHEVKKFLLCARTGILISVVGEKVDLEGLVSKDISMELFIGDNYFRGKGEFLFLNNGDKSLFSFEENSDVFRLKMGNMVSVAHLFNLADEIESLVISIENDKKKETNNADISIKIDYADANLFQTSRPNTITAKNVKFEDDGIKVVDAEISGNWFDIIGDLILRRDMSVRLEGKIRPYLPKDRVKYFFANKPKMTKDEGYTILKKGANFEEFNRSLIVNDIDFSLDENGKEKRSFVSWVMDQ